MKKPSGLRKVLMRAKLEWPAVHPGPLGLYIMKKILAVIIIMGFLPSLAAAEFRVTAQNLDEAFEIPYSRSPDGNYALFCINRGETTATFVGIMRTKRDLLLAETQLFSHGSDKKEYSQYLKVVWSSDSTLVAAHDSSRRHSKLFIYQVQNELVNRLKVPDLGSIMKSTLPTNIEVQSSGQIPIRWLSRTELLVLVRMKDKSDNMHIERFKIDPISGEININTEE